MPLIFITLLAWAIVTWGPLYPILWVLWASTLDMLIRVGHAEAVARSERALCEALLQEDAAGIDIGPQLKLLRDAGYHI